MNTEELEKIFNRLYDFLEDDSNIANDILKELEDDAEALKMKIEDAMNDGGDGEDSEDDEN